MVDSGSGSLPSVQALHNAAGNQLWRPETIEDEVTMLTEGAGDFRHRRDAGAHGPPARFIKEPASPSGRVVIPELLEGFLEKVSPDGLQVVAEQVAWTEALLNLQVRFPLEEEPGRLLQQRCPGFARHASRFSGADFVEGFVHFRDVGPRNISRG